MLRIFNRYYPIRNIVFPLIEGLIIFLSVLAAAYARFGGEFDLLTRQHLIAKVLLITAVCQLSLYYCDLYDFRKASGNIDLAIRIIQSLGIAYIVLACIYYIFPLVIIGRGIFLINLFLLLLSIVSWRLIYNWILKTRTFDQKVLIVGANELALKISDEIRAKKDSGFQIVGFARNDAPAGFDHDALHPTLGTFDQIRDIVKNHNIEKIVVALRERRGGFPAEQLLRCRLAGVEVEEALSFYERLTGKILVEGLYPSSIIFGSGFRKSKFTKTIKRTTGIMLSLVGMILCLPLLLITALLIRIESPGPIVFRQERVGEKGKIFKIWKFRSMIQDAEAEGEAVWATKNDPRITRVGRIVRKLRIDEIPQMINVLKGDMSFVGPRPERPQFVADLEKAIPYYSQRHTVRPGITGWAQVMYPYGSSVDDAREKLHYDLYYIKNLSPAFDFIIVLKTIKVILGGKGAR